MRLSPSEVFFIEISLEIEQSLRFLLEKNGPHPCLATGKRERDRGQCYRTFFEGNLKILIKKLRNNSNT